MPLLGLCLARQGSIATLTHMPLPLPASRRASPKQKAVRWLLAGLLAPVAATAIWGLSAFGLAEIPLHPDFTPPPPGAEAVEILVISNGVHTDVGLPYVSRWHDFRQELPVSDTKTPNLFMGADSIIAVGWGSRGFYLETPTWADLKVSTALKALFWLDRTAMHVYFFPVAPPLGPKVRRIRISPAQYERLVAFAAHQFAPPDGVGTPPAHPRRTQKPGPETLVFPPEGLHPVQIPGASYGDTDAFYEARDTYSLFNTCNTWTSRVLGAAGVTVGAWTPLEPNLMDSLPPDS